MHHTVLIVGILAVLATIGGLAYYHVEHHKSVNFLEINDTAIYDSWVHWKNRHNKLYNNAEEKQRFGIYKGNYQFVMLHNEKFENGESTFSVSLNDFADLTNEEFRATRLGMLPKVEDREDNFLVSALPTNVDWRGKAVSAVKNQGSCGSCWAFSTIGGIEGLYAVKNQKIQTFSEQQLVDCSTKYGNQGCNGGLMDQAFQYVKDNGITTEDKYPYKGTDGTCQTATKDFTISAYTDVPANSSAQLMAAIAMQPVSVAVDAASLWWQFYFGGVFNHNCGTSLDHGVLAVGYGSASGSNYYIVKNSWGSGWGESGYIRLSNNDATGPGECGIQMQASYPQA